MPLKSILVLLDFGAGDAAALQRAAQLAAAQRATMRLLHAPRGDAPSPADAARRLAGSARQLHERTGVRVKPVPTPARTMRQLAAEARWSDLVVVAGCRDRSIAAFFLGQPVQRLLRRCSCLLLVVRSSATGPYERVLVRGDGTASALPVRVAGGLAPRAAFELVEPCPASLGAAGRAVIARQQQSKADLVVIGTRRAPAWKDWLAPSVPACLWRECGGDLLLVPHDYAPSGRSATARRLPRDQERGRSAALALSRKRPS